MAAYANCSNESAAKYGFDRVFTLTRMRYDEVRIFGAGSCIDSYERVKAIKVWAS